MKKNKKITNVHDYTNEVDKIIATGKPMVEQFMDLMGLIGVTFIDTKLAKSDGSRKHDKSVQDKRTTEESSEVKQPEKGKNVDLSEMDRIKKRRKSYQNEMSDCCGAKVLVTNAIPDEGTRYWTCSECGKPCNTVNQSVNGLKSYKFRKFLSKWAKKLTLCFGFNKVKSLEK